MPKKQLVFFCFNIVFAMAGLGIIAPILPLLQKWGGVSYTTLGLFVSAFAFARTIFDIPGGILADRYCGSLLTVFGFSIILIGSFVSAIAPTFVVLFVGRFLAGVGSSFVVSSIQTQILILSSADQRSMAISYFTIARRAGASVFPFIGGVLASFFGWRAVFYFCVTINCIGLVMALVSYRWFDKKMPIKEFIKPKLTSEKPQEENNLSKNMRWNFFALYFLAFTLFVNRNGLEKTLIPLFGDLINIDSAMIGLVLSLSSIIGLVAIFISGHAADKYGRKIVLQIGLATLLVVNVLYLFVNNATGYFVIGILYGFTAFTMALPNTIAADITPDERMGRTTGKIRLFNDLGTLIGPGFLSFVMEKSGFHSSIFLATGITLLALLLSSFCLKESLQRETGKKPMEA